MIETKSKDAVVERLDKLYLLLGQIAADLKRKEPNYRYPLTAYWQFAWETIGATPVAHDGQGVTAVQWAGYTWMRRSGSGKFGEAIWFSRSDGKDEEGNNRYLRLVTFKALGEPERLDGRVARWQQQGQAADVSARQREQAPVVANLQTPPDEGLSAEQQARQTKEPERFATYFLAANPDWKNHAFVLAVLGELLDESPPLSPALVYDGLVAYREAFTTHYPQAESRTAAHEKALREARNKVAAWLLVGEQD